MYGRIDIELSYGTKVNEKCMEEFIKYWKNHPDNTVFNNIEFTIIDNSITSITAYPYDDVEISSDIEYVDRLSECIVSGYIDFIFTGEDYNIWGYRVEPGKVSRLMFFHVPIEFSYKASNYIKNLERSENYA